MNEENDLLPEEEMITVKLENGKEKDCKVITSFTVEETGKSYVIYTPFEELEDDEEQVFLYGARFEIQDGEVVLLQVSEPEDVELLNSVIKDMLDENKE